MTNRTNNNALQVAINGPSNARTWLAALRFRLLNVTQSEYLTASELSQWLHSQWLDHPEDIVQDFLDAMVKDGFIQQGRFADDVVFRVPQERLDRVDAAPAAGCSTCGGWHSMGGMSQHGDPRQAIYGFTGADGPQGCQCDPCRTWTPDAARHWEAMADED